MGKKSYNTSLKQLDRALAAAKQHHFDARMNIPLVYTKVGLFNLFDKILGHIQQAKETHQAIVELLKQYPVQQVVDMPEPPHLVELGRVMAELLEKSKQKDPEHYYRDVPHWFLDVDKVERLAEQHQQPAYLPTRELSISNLSTVYEGLDYQCDGPEGRQMKLSYADGPWISERLRYLFTSLDAYRWPWVPQVQIGGKKYDCGKDSLAPAP
jgi:hypothetical protein